MSEDVEDAEFSASLVFQVPEVVDHDKPTLVSIRENPYGFSHMIIVPSDSDGYFKGRLDSARENLFLCIPIRCEFSGSETSAEFKELPSDIVPTLHWTRPPSPKLTVYFDNPKLGSGNDSVGSLMTFPVLISEVRNLEGVGKGLVEITNWSGGVLDLEPTT